jgi:hypothetical protein
MALLR